MKQNKHKWLTSLAAMMLLFISTGCLPQLLEDALTQLLPLGKNPLQRVVVEVTMTSEQLRSKFIIDDTCEYIDYSNHVHLRYFSTGIFSSQTWFDKPFMAVFAEMMGHLADDQAFVLFRKYYVPSTTIISGRSDFDTKCYVDGRPEETFFCRGGGGLDFDPTQAQLCVFFFDDQDNDRIVVAGSPCEGSYYFPGCNRDCNDDDWTTPETILASFDADELLIIPAGQFYAGSTITETIEIPGTCGSDHTIILTLKTENANP